MAAALFYYTYAYLLHTFLLFLRLRLRRRTVCVHFSQNTPPKSTSAWLKPEKYAFGLIFGGVFLSILALFLFSCLYLPLLEVQACRLLLAAVAYFDVLSVRLSKSSEGARV